MFQVVGRSVEFVAVCVENKSDISSRYFMKIIRQLLCKLTLYFAQ